jgi:hypothetical protein
VRTRRRRKRVRGRIRWIRHRGAQALATSISENCETCYSIATALDENEIDLQESVIKFIPDQLSLP